MKANKFLVLNLIRKFNFYISRKLFLIVISCLIITPGFASDIWVSFLLGNDNYTTPNQTTPWRHIQYALDHAGYGDVIKVMNDGIYTETLYWPKVDGITLLGADYPNPIARTIIDPPSTGGRLISMKCADPNFRITNQTVIQHFILEYGVAPSGENGGGIFMDGYVAPTLNDLYIHHCTSPQDGGGIYYSPRNKFINAGNCYHWENIIPSCKMNSVVISGNVCPTGSGGGIFILGTDQQINLLCPEIDVNTPVLEMNECELYRNTVELNGGGICLKNALLIFTNGVLNNNSAASFGGGLYSETSCTRVYVSEFFDNNSTEGGAAYYMGGLRNKQLCNYCANSSYNNEEHFWDNVRCWGNTANDDGGCLYFDGGDATQLNNYMDFVFNRGSIILSASGGNGGGIYIHKTTTLNLFDVEISNNIADNGGGIYNNCSWSNATNSGWTGFHHFEQLLITENTAILYGAGIYTRQSFSCINSTIAVNDAQNGQGGGIACFSYVNPINQLQPVTPSFLNSIFWGNTKSSGILNQVHVEVQECQPQFNHCDIEGFNPPNTGFLGNGAPYWYYQNWTYLGVPITNGNINQDPIFTTNYMLPSNSPCKDFGYSNLCQSIGFPQFGSYFYFPWGYDFISNTRIVNTIDMGVYEVPAKNGIIINESGTIANSNEPVSISPNPWNSTGLSISLVEKDAAITNIKVATIYGQTLYENNNVNGNNFQITTNKLAPKLNSGVLIISIDYLEPTGTVKSFVKKVVKL